MTEYKFGIYAITSCYGGAEEGGWYYEDGNLIHTFTKKFQDQATNDEILDYENRLENVLEKKSSLILNHKKKYHITNAETDEEIFRGEAIGYEKLWVKFGIHDVPETWLDETPYYC